MNYKRLSLLSLSIALLSTACVDSGSGKKNSSTTSSSDSSSSGTGTVTIPGTPPDDTSDPSLPPYFSLPEIVVHGTAHANRNPPPNGIFWSSERNVAAVDQHIFRTDARMNIRIKAMSGVGQGTTDSNGINCSQRNDYAYTKLSTTVCVRAAAGSCVSSFTFENIDVGSYSNVKEFSVPANTSDPVVVEVTSVMWDYDYYHYLRGGTDLKQYYNDPNADHAKYPVWDLDCVRFQLEFSNDDTQDLPGPRY